MKKQPEETQLATRENSEPPSILGMMEKLTQGGMTSENVAMMTQLVGLHERMEAKAAERAFARDFVALQASITGITANKIVPTKSGATKYTYAPYEEIMEKVKPALFDNGFSVSFNTKITGDGKDNRVISECTIMHRDGHCRVTEFPCRVGSGPPDASPAQADGAAATYAQRFALCKMLNIVIETDDDAGAIGPKADPARLNEIELRIEGCGLNTAGFLKAAGVDRLDQCKPGQLDSLCEVLTKRERANEKQKEA